MVLQRAPELRGLVRIIKNLDRVKNPRLLKERLAPAYQDLLGRGYKAFYNKLSRNSVSGSFHNSFASRRLLNSFEKDLDSVLRIQNGGLRFSFAIRSSPETSGHGDPAEYYSAIDDVVSRQRGPNKERVRQWLTDRGIITPGQKTVELRDGRTASVNSLVFLTQRTIWRKTRTRAYKSLHLTAMFAKVADIENPNGILRTRVRGTLSKIIVGED